MPAVAAAALIRAPADAVDAELLLAAIRTPDERAGDEIGSNRKAMRGKS
jgi:hypothetical protein